MEKAITTVRTEIKSVTLDAGSTFTANGKKYFISETFSIGRYQKVEELEEELRMLSDTKTCHVAMYKAMVEINKQNWGGAYTILHNKIESDQRNAKLTHYIMRMCAAYINYEGEDLGYLTDETIAAKVHDWSEEGLDVRPFLIFVVSAFKEILTLYKNDLADILQQAKTIKEAITEARDMKILTVSNGEDQP